MRTWTLALLVLFAAAIGVISARSQEQGALILSRLMEFDRELVGLCKTGKDWLDDREWELWKRRRDLLNSLDDRQRDEFGRASLLKGECRSTLEALARRRDETQAKELKQRPKAYYRIEVPRPYAAPSLSQQSAPAAPPPPSAQVPRPTGPLTVGPSFSKPAPGSTITAKEQPNPSVTAAPPEPKVAYAPATPASTPVESEPRIKSLFPWPPPTPSTRRSFSPDVDPAALPAKTVGEVASRLEQVVRRADFEAFGYYRVPGGFALVTRIESLDGATGRPLPGESRWATAAVYYAGLSLTSIFATSRPKGTYRTFVFTQRWAMEGAPSLPAEIKVLPIGSNHVLIVMVYEFEKVEGGETKHFLPSHWTLDQHLASLGVSLKPAP